GEDEQQRDGMALFGGNLRRVAVERRLVQRPDGLPGGGGYGGIGGGDLHRVPHHGGQALQRGGDGPGAGGRREEGHRSSGRQRGRSPSVCFSRAGTRRACAAAEERAASMAAARSSIAVSMCV